MTATLLTDRATLLEHIAENLDLYRSFEPGVVEAPGPTSPGTVFIIHGHSIELRLQLDVLLHKHTNVQPVVMMSEAN